MELSLIGNGAGVVYTPIPFPKNNSEELITFLKKSDEINEVPHDMLNILDEEQIDNVVEQANGLMEIFGRDLKFQKYKETDIMQISVVDRNDGKVIRQIPPDFVLDMVARIQKILGGLFDVKA